jgi:hypothetical protein
MTALRVFAAQGILPEDPGLREDLVDVLILREHPGWTYDDLQRMPQRLLDLENDLVMARDWHRENTEPKRG